MRKLFVTGGSGFLGRTLIAEAVKRGTAVRGLARSAAAEATIRSCGGEPVRGDLDDVDVLRAGMTGCDAVIHAAAVVDEWGDPALFHRVNVAGTRHALGAAAGAGVRRFVHISTAWVLAGPSSFVQVNETVERPAAPYGLYALTKGLAEDEVRSANGNDLFTVIIRPPIVWGRGDTSTLPKVAAAVRAGRFRWIAGGRYLISAAHVANVAEAALLAAERGPGGETYFVTDGEPIEFRRFVTALLETQGVPVIARSVPRGVARVAAAATESLWRLLRLTSTPPVTRMTVKMMGEEVTFDDSKARRELGYVGHMTFARGIEEMRQASDRVRADATR